MAKGKLTFQTPIGLVLRGFCYEPSAWDKNQFRIEILVQPLYLPYEHLIFLISHDLGYLSEKRQRQVWWTINDGIDNVMTDVRKRVISAGMKWLEIFSSPRDIASKAKANSETSPDDLHLLRAIAYSWIMCGDQHKALDAMERLRVVLYGRDSSIPWIREMADEVTNINEKLHIDMNKASEELMKYRERTVEKLGLSKWSGTEI